MIFKTEILGKQHDRKAFRCGVEVLDLYFRQFAAQDAKRRISGCYVVVDATGAVAGYFTLAATSVALDSLPAAMGVTLPRYPTVPAILIGRLAVSLDRQGRGLGRAMIADAVGRIDAFGIGAFAIIVDAKDDGAKAYYETLGFTGLVDNRLRMILSMADALPK